MLKTFWAPKKQRNERRNLEEIFMIICFRKHSLRVLQYAHRNLNQPEKQGSIIDFGLLLCLFVSMWKNPNAIVADSYAECKTPTTFHYLRCHNYGNSMKMCSLGISDWFAPPYN